MANSIKLNETKKYHFIYKTTNLLNGKYYIGMHSTNNLKDGYLGSGKRLRRSIRKYGKHNFKCEILEYCVDFNSLKEREKELVTEESIKDVLCMNLKPGGLGGFKPEDSSKGRILGGIGLAKRLKTDLDYRKIHIERWATLLKKRHQLGLVKYDNSQGLKHSPETKQKMSLSRKNKGIGSNNSQFGKCWITNGNESKKIKNTEIIPDGWYKGRIGKEHSEETKKLLSIKAKQQWNKIKTIWQT